MTTSEILEYHSDRANRERDLGLRAQSIKAARAHLELSSLHMERARALGGGVTRGRPILVMD